MREGRRFRLRTRHVLWRTSRIGDEDMRGQQRPDQVCEQKPSEEAVAIPSCPPDVTVALTKLLCIPRFHQKAEPKHYSRALILKSSDGVMQFRSPTWLAVIRFKRRSRQLAGGLEEGTDSAASSYLDLGHEDWVSSFVLGFQITDWLLHRGENRGQKVLSGPQGS